MKKLSLKNLTAPEANIYESSPDNLATYFDYQEKIYNFLREDVENHYDNFYEWFLKMSLEIAEGSRKLIAMIDNDEIVGVSILKLDPDEYKICSFKINKFYRNLSYGTKLLDRSLEIINSCNEASTTVITITVPIIISNDESKLSICKFLTRRGFYLDDILYLPNGKIDLKFSLEHYVGNSTVVLSIKQKYSDGILEGTKKVEFRRKPLPKTVDKVLINTTFKYSSPSVISGVFKVDNVVEDTIDNLWKKYHDIGGISKSEFDRYFESCDKGYAILIKDLKRIDLPFKDLFIKSRSPQFYFYL